MTGTAPRTLEIITPSYAPDFELCRDLVASVRRFAPPGTVHRIIVSRADRELFAQLAGDGVVVEVVADLLPSTMRKLPFANAWVSLRRPWPPVRGWIAQQIVKLGAAARSGADRVLLVDSDIVFIRPFSADDMGGSGAIPLYRLTGAVHAGMTRHVLWDAVARDLLGLPASDDGALPDYICCPCPWSPDVVRSLLASVQEHAGMPWQIAIGRQLHFSEMVLYGVYADAFVSPAEDVTVVTDMKCVNHYEETPLDGRGLSRLLESAAQTDVALMVSAKSGTALSTRRDTLAALWADR
jgi:hypothetical protein